MSKSSVKKWLLFLVKAAVTGGLIWVVLRGVDLATLKRHISDISLVTITFALALLGVQTVLAGVRWNILMSLFGPSLGVPLTTRVTFEGVFFNQALPSTVGGDGIRIYRVYRQGLTVGDAFNGVLLDRVAGFISLILLVAAVQPLLHQRIDDERALIAFTAIMGFGVFASVALLSLASLPEQWARWRIIRGFMRLSDGARTMFRTPRVVLPVLGYSLIGHALMVLAVYLIASDIGLKISYLDCLMVVPSVLLVATVPISIAGWGVREGAMVAAFALLGAETAPVTALSLVLGLCLIGVGLPGGILWFLNPDRRVVDAAELTEAEAGKAE